MTDQLPDPLVPAGPTSAAYAELLNRADLARLFSRALDLKAKNDRRYWDVIRQIWSERLPEVMAGRRIDPYFVDWMKVFTPIEQSAWGSIRGNWLPFYPQFPVGRRFLDFGDPIKRIGIECDGKQFHDPSADRERDAELLFQGWVIYRIQGSECFKPDYIDEESSEYEIKQWLTSSAEGVIRSIAVYHYEKHYGRTTDAFAQSVLLRHMYQQLD